MDKTIRIELVGPQAIIDGALDAFVRAYGWEESHVETKEEKARAILREFMMNTVKMYQAEAAAIAARQAAIAGSEGAMNEATLTLEVAQ